MLSPAELALIVATTAACTVVVTLLALWALRWNKRGSIASQIAIVTAAAVLSIVTSTVAVVLEMFISVHDLTVLCWVIGVSALLSLGAAWLITNRTVRHSVATLTDSAQRIADGDVVESRTPGWKEFNNLHAQLADTSSRLAAARAEVEKLDSARRQFFAWISHDLRTPLAGMRAMTEALDDGLAADPGAYVRTIQSKVDTLTSMVDDLFALSTLQSGTLKLDRELVALLDIVSDAVVDVRAAASSRDIRIIHTGVAGHMLWADPRELTRAIGNLLANGVRHAPEGTDILISAHTISPRTTSPHTTDDEHLVISVLDHGTGVDSADLGHMFDVGWRAGTARTTDADTHAGAGLGLAIVRGIVEAHGGHVDAAHAPDGFQLELTLPVGRP